MSVELAAALGAVGGWAIGLLIAYGLICWLESRS